MQAASYDPEHYLALARAALSGAMKAEQEMPGRAETFVIANLATLLTATVEIAEAARSLCRDEFPIPEGGRLKADHLISWKAAAAAAVLGVEEMVAAGQGDQPLVQLVAKVAECLGRATDELIRLYAASAK